MNTPDPTTKVHVTTPVTPPVPPKKVTVTTETPAPPPTKPDVEVKVTNPETKEPFKKG